MPKTGSLLALTGTSSIFIPIGRVGDAGGAACSFPKDDVIRNDSFIFKLVVVSSLVFFVTLLCVVC